MYNSEVYFVKLKSGAEAVSVKRKPGPAYQ